MLGLGLLACAALLVQGGDAMGGVGTPVPHHLLLDQLVSQPAAGSVTYTPMRRPGTSIPAAVAQPSLPSTKAPVAPANAPAAYAAPASAAPSPFVPKYTAPAPAALAPIAPTYAAPAPVAPTYAAPALVAPTYAPPVPGAPAPVAPVVAVPASVAPIYAAPTPGTTWALPEPYLPAPLPVATSPGMATQSIRDANVEPSGTVAAKSIRPPKAGHRFLGVVSDVGMPDGLNLGLVLAPADWMRMVAAIGSNSASLDYRGGLSLVPMGWGPSFTLEVGHCNTAPTTSVIRAFFTVPSWVQPYVQQLGYTYVNAHVGFDYRLGGFTLFVHGGVSYLDGTLRSPASVVVDSKTNTSIKIAEDGSVTAYTLSAKAGLLYMFGGL
jgi:hypothetical protein